jgi:hypothetical protein
MGVAGRGGTNAPCLLAWWLTAAQSTTQPRHPGRAASGASAEDGAGASQVIAGSSFNQGPLDGFGDSMRPHHRASLDVGAELTRQGRRGRTTKGQGRHAERLCAD